MLVRQAEVFLSSISNTTDRYMTRVTLPAAPWEDGQPLADLMATRAALRLGSAAGERCAVPGCSAVLRPGNTSGVCQVHTHRKGYCHCRTCRRSAGGLFKG